MRAEGFEKWALTTIGESSVVTLLRRSSHDLTVAPAQLVRLWFSQHLLEASQRHIEHEHLRAPPRKIATKSTSKKRKTSSVHHLPRMLTCTHLSTPPEKQAPCWAKKTNRKRETSQ